jgi:hypothetical protein
MVQHQVTLLEVGVPCSILHACVALLGFSLLAFPLHLLLMQCTHM